MFLILDTFNFLHRAYHAIPATFRDSKGQPTNAVYGVSSMLVSLLTEYNPTYVVAAMESKEKENFRVSDFAAYKAHRPEMENDLRVQIPVVEEILTAIGIPQLTFPGFEADDIIGSLVNLIPTIFASAKIGSEAKPSVPPLSQSVLIISNDRDFIQLINQHVQVLSPSLNSKNPPKLYDEAAVRAEYGFEPRQIIDYKALRGDPSDGIPGVFGIGEKTAKELVVEFGTIENLYQNLGKVTKESVRQKLAENAEMAVKSKELATIHCEVPLTTFDLKSAKLAGDWKDKAIQVFSGHHFKSLVKRLSPEEAKTPPADENQLTLL